MALYKKITALFNPAAGRGKGEALKAELDAALEGNSALSNLVTATGFTSNETVTAAAQSSDLIVLFGGDGTVHHAVNALMKIKSRIPIAYYPLGTGNDLAFALGMQRSSPALFIQKVAEEPYHKKLDVFSINGSFWFTNYFGLGFDGHATENYEKALTKLKGSPLLSLPLAKKAVWTAMGGSALLTWKKKVKLKPGNNEYFGLLFSNLPYYGGGAVVCEEAKTDDGKPERTLFTSPTDFLAMLVNRSWLGAQAFDTGAATIDMPRRVVLEEAVPVQLDGENYSNQLGQCTEFLIEHAGWLTVCL